MDEPDSPHYRYSAPGQIRQVQDCCLSSFYTDKCHQTKKCAATSSGHVNSRASPISLSSTPSAPSKIILVGNTSDQPAFFEHLVCRMKTGDTKYTRTYIPSQHTNGHYLISDEIEKSILNMDKIIYIWISQESLHNVQWMDLVKVVVKKQLGHLENRKDIQKAAGIRLFCPGVPASKLPIELQHCVRDASIQLKELDLFKAMRDELYALTESVTKELFLRLEAKLTPVKLDTRGQADNGTKCFKWLLDALQDSASTVRQHMQRQHKLPHMHVVEINEQNHALTIEIRPTQVNFFHSFVLQCKTNQLGSLWVEHLKRSQGVFPATIEVSINETCATEVGNMLKRDVKEEETTRISTVLQTDGHSPFVQTNLVTGLQGEMKTLTAKGVSFFSNLFQDILSNKSRTPAEFLKILKDRECSKNELLRLRDSKSNPALHMTVLAERSDFLEMFLDIGLWGRLREQIARPRVEGTQAPPPTYGYTAWRTAESLSYKNSGQALFKKFEECERNWKSLLPPHKACLIGDLPLSRAIVESLSGYGSRNVKDTVQHDKCMYYATGSGNTGLVEYLLHKFKDDRTHIQKCVELASKLGHTEIVKLLSPWVLVNTNYDALENCALNGDIKGAQIIQEFDMKKWTPRIVVLATKTRQEGFVEYVLKQDPRIDVNSGGTDDGQLALHHAASNGSIKIINLLLAHDADLTKLDSYHRSAIYLAIESKHIAAAQLLINEAKKNNCWKSMVNQHDLFTGRDIYYVLRGKEKGRKAWHWIKLNRLLLHKFRATLKSGQIDLSIFGQMIHSGHGTQPGEQAIAEVKHQQDVLLSEAHDDFTLLHVAVINQCVPLVEVLLEEGADPNARDFLHASPLHYAAMYGSVEILALLVKYKGEVLAHTTDGRTPLQVAGQNGQDRVVNYLESFAVMQKVQNFHGVMDTVKKNLDKDTLNEHRLQGLDVRRFMINALRDLNIDVNVMLQNLGSGPITETQS